MVDPTWKTTCPACGDRVPKNQMGQIYGHQGMNGCPYSGNRGLLNQHIFPLKFDYFPVMTAVASYLGDQPAATIRYGLEEPPAAGEFLSLRTADGDVFGYAKVHGTMRGTVYDAIRWVRDREAHYSHSGSEDLLDALNGYYDDEITPDTEVVGILYTPKDIPRLNPY